MTHAHSDPPQVHDGRNSPPQIDARSLNDYLAVMSRAVMQTGMSWRVVDKKWPGMVDAFHGFEPEWVAGMSPPEFETLVTDPRIIRNRAKVTAIVHNAERMLERERESGSFQAYLRAYGDYDKTERALRKEFKFLGAPGCYYFLYVVKEPVPPYHQWREARQ